MGASEGETNYELQVRLVEQALEALGGGTPHKGADIRNWLQANCFADYMRLQASWGSYLSRAVADPQNRIERTPGSYTYSLKAPMPSSAPPPEVVQEEAPAEPCVQESVVGRQRRELTLYPALATWLRSRGYSAKVTAATKRGGAWGNPDVTGIRIVDGFLGQKNLEVATVEAKASDANWRYHFFEAVAHKRFAHRAYFAFAYGSDEPTLSQVIDAQEMREYGEKYRVGIVVVFVANDTFEQLTKGNANELELDDVRVEELWPAIYDDVTARAQMDFLHEVLEIATDADIYRFDPEPA